jgi:hypothetical protein
MTLFLAVGPLSQSKQWQQADERGVNRSWQRARQARFWHRMRGGGKRFLGFAESQVINRDVHAEKCAFEARDRWAARSPEADREVTVAVFTSDGVVRGSSYNNGAARAARWRANCLRISPSHPSWRRLGFCHRPSSQCLAFPACRAPPQPVQAKRQSAHSHRFRDAAMKNHRRGQPALPKFHRGSRLSPRSGRTSSSALGGLPPQGARRRAHRRLQLTAILDRHRALHRPVPISASFLNRAAPPASQSSASPVGAHGQHSLRFLPPRPW